MKVATITTDAVPKRSVLVTDGLSPNHRRSILVLMKPNDRHWGPPFNAVANHPSSELEILLDHNEAFFSLFKGITAFSKHSLSFWS